MFLLISTFSVFMKKVSLICLNNILQFKIILVKLLPITVILQHYTLYKTDFIPVININRYLGIYNECFLFYRVGRY